MRSLESDLQTQVMILFTAVLSTFTFRYSNGNFFNFWYQNQAIQKSKFIYASKTTTLMKDSKSEKIVLKNRILQQSG